MLFFREQRLAARLSPTRAPTVLVSGRASRTFRTAHLRSTGWLEKSKPCLSVALAESDPDSKRSEYAILAINGPNRSSQRN